MKKSGNNVLLDSKTLSSISNLICGKKKKVKNKISRSIDKNIKKKIRVKQLIADSGNSSIVTPVLGNKSNEKKTNKLKKRKQKIKNTATSTQINCTKQVIKDLLEVQNPTHVPKKVSKNNSNESLRERMQNQLKSSRFRYLNERLYTNEGKEAKKFFQHDPDSFEAYHEGFRQQVAKWPMNPLDEIISAIRKMPSDKIIADFGCGEAKLARSVPHNVYSFDLLETVPGVIACDMANCQLPSGSVDVAVYCLSLMGINLRDYLAEANRVLKMGGILKIAEVESRFVKQVDNFIKALRSFGFTLQWRNSSHNLFYFFDFKKDKNIQDKKKLPALSLSPCLYKKR